MYELWNPVLKKACEVDIRIHYCFFSATPINYFDAYYASLRAIVIAKVAYFDSLYFEKVNANILLFYNMYNYNMYTYTFL